MKLVYRDGRIEDVCPSGSQKFLYRNFFGRIILKILTRPFFTKFMGWFLSTRLSKKRIPKFIKSANINPDDYILDNINSYNDFFTRKIKDGKRIINMDQNILISPCDSRLTVYKINEDSIFNIKDSYYKVSDLLNDESLAKEYLNGYAFVFRLDVSDYHRYSYIDSGKKEKNIHIKGIFHTVNQIALERYNFYKTNSREYTILHTNNFGDVIMCEVGAMMVGKIKNHHEEYEFKKGEEKGYFEFGGSTIVLLIKDIIDIDLDILNNSKSGNETRVYLGERIAIRK